MKRAGISSAIESENAWATQATTKRIINDAELLIRLNWATKTLEGESDRVFPEFITLGKRKDEPSPAIKKLILSIHKARGLFSTPIIFIARIPAIKEVPETIEAILTKVSIENLPNKRCADIRPTIMAKVKRIYGRVMSPPSMPISSSRKIEAQSPTLNSRNPAQNKTPDMVLSILKPLNKKI